MTEQGCYNKRIHGAKQAGLNSKVLEVVASISSNKKVPWKTPGRNALFKTLNAAEEKETNNFSIHDRTMANYGTFPPTKVEGNFFVNFIKSAKSYNH